MSKSLIDSSKHIHNTLGGTVQQALELEKRLTDQDSLLVYYLEVSDEILVKRLEGRLGCKQCGLSIMFIFHLQKKKKFLKSIFGDKMSDLIPDQEFQVGLKAFIEKEGRILILRSNPKGIYRATTWGVPGGKINIHEVGADFSVTLQREINEELGNDFQVKIGDIFYMWKFLRPSKTPILLVGFSCEYLGGTIHLSPEFDTYKWINFEDADQYTFLPGHAEAIRRVPFSRLA